MSEFDASVLIAEDDSMIRRLEATIIRRCGCTVVEARNGEEALAALERQTFDLVVLDLMLPRISGFEVLAKLALEYPEQRVVVVTAASDDDLSRIDRTTVSEVVRKPFEIDNIRNVILRALKSGRRDESEHATRIWLKDSQTDEPQSPTQAANIGSSQYPQRQSLRSSERLPASPANED